MKSLQRKSALIFILIFFSAFPAFCGGFGAAGAGALSFDEGKLQMAGGLCADYQPDGLPFIFEGEALFCQDGLKSLCGGVEFIAGNINLYKALNFFYCPELGAGYDFEDDKVIISNAIFAGLNGFFIPQTEFFIQAGWRPEILLGRGNVDFRFANFPVRAGLRFWTK